MNVRSLHPQPGSSSPIRDVNPLLKLTGTCIMLVLINLGQEFRIPLYYGTLLVPLLVMARIPIRWFLKRMLIILPFLILLSLIMLLPGLVGGDSFPPHRLGLIWIKTFTSFALITVLSAVTPFNDLLLTLERIRIPRAVVLISRFAHTYLYVIFDEWTRTLQALKSRSARLRRNRIAVVGHICAFILIKTYLRSRQIFHSMVGRNFIGFSRHPLSLSFQRRDYIALGVFLAAVVPGVVL